jgi:hypothetical protein
VSPNFDWSQLLTERVLLWTSAVLLLIVVWQWSRARFSAWWRRHVILSRQAHAYACERDAPALLRRHGFHVEAAQARIRYELHLDGKPLTIALCVDFLVSRNGLRYAADVKSGEQATRLENPATRRQLLEYQLAYDVDGVLLIDVERERIRRVEFP